MRPSKAHFVTSCQQLLALGAVLAVLAPAASVISLDVVATPAPSPAPAAPTRPAAPAGTMALPGAPGDPTDATRPAPRQVTPQRPAVVPAGEVEPTVSEVPLTRPEPTPRPAASPRRSRPDPQPSAAPVTSVVSEPQPVEGYGAVGVTWSAADEVPDGEIRFEVRTRTDGRWSEWTDIEYHDEHEADAVEGDDVRPGTDPVLVGTVDAVQVRAVAERGLPADLSLAVVDPGAPAAVDEEAPELSVGDGSAGDAASAPGEGADGSDQLALQAGTTGAPQPTIFSRRQWGANERLRDGRPRYGSISAGFVHHTVNANNYSRSDVPAILRGIYAYHTQSRGWSDIGYNFLVDRFGRIWEGRAGGIARPVIGAHTLGYNEDSFAMSAIGNFDTARPSEAMLRAYGALFAWKLGMYGIDPMDRRQRVNGDLFQAINGHRDAGSTACPGRYLYAKLETIRRYAKEAGQPEDPAVEPEQVDSDLVGSPYPDLVVRRASDGRGVILPTGGLSRFLDARPLRSGWGSRTALAVPDLSGDGRVDVLTLDATGAVQVRPTPPSGGLGAVTRTIAKFRGHQLLTSVGDVNGDRRPDLVARRKGRLVAFLGNRRGSFRRVTTSTGLRGHQQLSGAGDVTGDGRPDLWAMDKKHRLLLHRGLGQGDFAPRQRVAGDWSGYDWLVGGVDYTGDGVPDLLARRTSGSLMLFPARGDGTLERAVGPVRGKGLSMITGAGQLVGDPSPDLLATRGDGSLAVVRNRGTFNVGAPIDTGRSFGKGDLLLNAGDFTGDGHGDVILRRQMGSLWVYQGDGTGRLSTPTWIGGKAFGDVTGLRVVGDLTGDGAHDLLGTLTDGRTMVWAGNGAARLGERSEIDLADDPPARGSYRWLVPISDLRRRGPADLVARDRSGYLYRLNGSSKGYGSPRYLGEAAAYDLGG